MRKGVQQREIGVAFSICSYCQIDFGDMYPDERDYRAALASSRLEKAYVGTMCIIGVSQST